MQCVKCKSQNLVKDGKQLEVQRYKCKECNKIFQKANPKYSPEFKLECIKMYLNSCGIRSIARVKNVSNSLVIYWIKKVANSVRDLVSKKSEIITKEDIVIMEVDELCTYIKKNLIETKKLNNGSENTLGYGLLWIGTEIKLGDRANATYVALALRLEERYNIIYLCTDDYTAYSYYKISEKHIIDKAETCLVEAKNSSLRDMLARLNRKTKRVSKCIKMLHNSILLWANRELISNVNYF